MKNPERHAETIRTAYQRYLEGRNGRSARSVATRLRPDAAGEDTLTGMRGPYLQALPVANWSDTDWQSFARSQSLHPNVRRAFHEEGFQRLYDFQERSVETILDSENTVITAATGRGKTEAWLIPILDQIVKEKRNGVTDGRTSTKALLLYPTKALAQDQFKRLVQILYRINRNLRQKEWVTVGIYDGDTPRHIFEDEAQGYLNRTFEHFGCPGCNDDLEKCQSCGQGVFVERTTDDFKLRPDKPECETDEDHRVPLNFVRMTRNGLMDEGADIVLTNPDTLNYRLFNINAETEHETFVTDPDFLVFDEVHTYDGLLGSYTATLVKRLRQRRQAEGCDSLQVIGSSATVDNDVELFRQVSGAQSVASVSEDPTSLSARPPTEVPQSLYDDRVSIGEILDAGRGRGHVPQLGEIDLEVPESGSLDNDRLRDRVADELFDTLRAEDVDDPVVQTVQTLHEELRTDPRPPNEFRGWVAEEFNLEDDQAEVLVDNFQTIGQFSGLLESRHHLFSWPLDGFYTCSACTAVYRSPQESCEVCDSQFVTRATYCSQCDDEYLLAQACSQCDQLTPYVHTEEGLIGESRDQACPYCDASTGSQIAMHTVLFRPVQECGDCGQHRERSVTGSCSACGSPGVPTTDGQFVCRNPDCEQNWERETACGRCGSDNWTATVASEPVDCPDCGAEHESNTLPLTCECGETVANTRLVPWSCTHCETLHWGRDPPETCSCGSDAFVKQGLFDLSNTLECENCGDVYLPGWSCSCDDPAPSTNQNPYRRYKTWLGDGMVASPLTHDDATPCEHDLWSTVVGDAFSELMRSPTNVSVTTTQYLLRNVADTEGFDAAKLLAFSDSHSDMKDLDRSFTDPEVDSALDQLVLCALELCRAEADLEALDSETLQTLRPGSSVDECESPWVSLAAVVEMANDLIDVLEVELTGESAIAHSAPDLREVILGTSHVRDKREAVREKLRRRALQTVGERGSPGHGSLETAGLLDVRLHPSAKEALEPSHRRVLAALVDSGDGVERDDRRLDGVHGNAIEELVDGGVLEIDDGRLWLDPSTVEVARPEDGTVAYDPGRDDYYSQLHAEFGDIDDIVSCPDSIEDRADPDNPRFTDRAYTATNSRLTMLLSELYFGATPKMRRREIEHQFRDEPYPHFLSSGPTMELGVDIGSLDALLLNGTPPNMNAYLQRVGRAGRSSHSSLVHSVSQRNPIDYYYYDEPTELITADEQPVPLNEHNERVLGISLAWAVLDYIAMTYTIPWNVTRHSVSGGEEIRLKEDAAPNVRENAAKFSQLLAKSVGELGLGTDASRLRPLGTLIADDEAGVREYLTDLLDYAYCPTCARHYDRERSNEECSAGDCDGLLVDAVDEYGSLVDDAIEAVTDVYVNGFERRVNQLEQRIARYEDRLERLDVELDDADPDETRRLEAELDQVEARVDVLRQYRRDLSSDSFYTVLDEEFGEYAFNLRSVSDNVDISVVDETGDPERIGGENGGRASRLALTEVHPYAAYLHDRRPHVVARVHTDDKKSEDIRERIDEVSGSDTNSPASYEYICQGCGAVVADPDTACECSDDTDYLERRFFALDSVEATLDTQRLPNGRDTAGSMYEKTGTRVQNTFALRETEILAFDATEQFRLEADDGSYVGTLAYGDYDILEYTGSCRAKYKNGSIDEAATQFRLCDEPDCSGIIYNGEDEQDVCSVNPEHRPEDGSNSVLARFGYQYETEGVRLTLADHDIEVTHSLAHGLRLGLQKLSGVTIRDVNEYIGADHVDVFDAQEGGAAVSRALVTRRDGTYRNFEIARSLMAQQFDCECDNGCPRCLYQYGCAKRNDPNSLARQHVRELLADGLNLVSSGQ
ncbi:DEAD/DEAH box helicase [Haloarchaeobius amylolyticus]|uniref:DEAD/DEAH box helicase n=1 Tax=Haloarchaeobius amylolyticus TaxID=1198296 RepID=UPI00226E3D0F|nr:DEAD/DEAH box helicase [Haloarchaeobius amylolyticus]